MPQEFKTSNFSYLLSGQSFFTQCTQCLVHSPHSWPHYWSPLKMFLSHVFNTNSSLLETDYVSHPLVLRLSGHTYWRHNYTETERNEASIATRTPILPEILMHNDNDSNGLVNLQTSSQQIQWNLRYSPTAKPNPLSQVLELVWQPPLLDDAPFSNRHLTQREVRTGICDSKFLQCEHYNFMGRCLLMHQKVFTRLVRFVHFEHVLWIIWWTQIIVDCAHDIRITVTVN